MLKRFSIISILVVLLLADVCHFMSHQSGLQDDYSFVLFHQTIFSRNAKKPQNYTIGYKYLSPGTTGVLKNVQLDVNGANESYATINFSKNIRITENRSVNATVRIKNATDFISTIETRGVPGFDFDFGQMDWIFNAPTMKWRSYALICTEKRDHALSSSRRIYEFGERGPTDKLIHFQREIIRMGKDKVKPRFTFDFKDNTVEITYLVLKSDSPWAVVFANKVTMTDHEFHATVYGLKQNAFTIEFIAFGKRIST